MFKQLVRREKRSMSTLVMQFLLLGLLTAAMLFLFSYVVTLHYRPFPLFLPFSLLFSVMCGCLVFIVGVLVTYLDQKGF